jgi:hypothetical protein
VSARGLSAIFFVAFAVFITFTLPMSVVMSWLNVERLGVSYGRAVGPVWAGTVEEVAWRGVSLGDVQISFRPSALLLGRASVRVEMDGSGALAGAAIIERGMGTLFTIRDAVLTAQADQLPVLVPVSGSVALNISEATFDTGGCRSVYADLQTDALARPPAGLEWAGPILSGTASCVDGAVTIPLTGREGSEVVSLAMTLQHDRTFNLRASVNTGNDALASMLGAIGFAIKGGTYTLVQNGRWG